MKEMTATVLGLLIVLPVWEPVPRQASPGGYKLAKIEVVGAQRLTAADVVSLSGLTPGQPIGVPDVDPALRRMSETGLFKNLRYRYVTAGTALTLTLEVEEEAWTTPVVFDNFVWLSDAELLKSVRERVPTFDGVVPATEAAAGYLTNVLQGILDARKIDGRVQHLSRLHNRTKRRQFVFSVAVAGRATPLCALRFAGASPDVESELQQAIKSEIGAAYSRALLTDYADGLLVDVYRKRAQWRARFGALSAAPGETASCRGITALLQVEQEGPRFVWDRARWAGQTALTPAELDGLLGIKAGDAADVSRIDAGLQRVRAAYERKGYLLAQSAFTPRLDDAGGRAAFDFSVTEGPQFRMGTVEFVGVPPAEAAELARKWQLKPGDVYDASYLRTFRVTSGKPPRPLTPEQRIDVERRVVDVRFVAK